MSPAEHVHGPTCRRIPVVAPLLLVVALPDPTSPTGASVIVRGTIEPKDIPDVLRGIADEHERKYRASLS